MTKTKVYHDGAVSGAKRALDMFLTLFLAILSVVWLYPVALILLSFRKGGKPGLIWEEAALHRADGTPTDYYRKLYHLEG